MELEKLKQGDTFYRVTLHEIRRFEYLMLYPFHNPINVKVKGYHILLDKAIDEPVRMYYTEIEKILEQKCFDYETAKKLQVEKLEKHLNYLKNEQL